MESRVSRGSVLKCGRAPKILQRYFATLERRHGFRTTAKNLEGKQLKRDSCTTSTSKESVLGLCEQGWRQDALLQQRKNSSREIGYELQQRGAQSLRRATKKGETKKRIVPGPLFPILKKTLTPQTSHIRFLTCPLKAKIRSHGKEIRETTVHSLKERRGDKKKGQERPRKARRDESEDRQSV